jgi:hypothetical protein
MRLHGAISQQIRPGVVIMQNISNDCNLLCWFGTHSNKYVFNATLDFPSFLTGIFIVGTQRTLLKWDYTAPFLTGIFIVGTQMTLLKWDYTAPFLTVIFIVGTQMTLLKWDYTASFLTGIFIVGTQMTLLKWDYTALYPNRLSYSYSPPWEPDVCSYVLVHGPERLHVCLLMEARDRRTFWQKVSRGHAQIPNSARQISVYRHLIGLHTSLYAHLLPLHPSMSCFSPVKRGTYTKCPLVGS